MIIKSTEACNLLSLHLDWFTVFFFSFLFSRLFLFSSYKPIKLLQSHNKNKKPTFNETVENCFRSNEITLTYTQPIFSSERKSIRKCVMKIKIFIHSEWLFIQNVSVVVFMFGSLPHFHGDIGTFLPCKFPQFIAHFSEFRNHSNCFVQQIRIYKYIQSTIYLV